IISHRPSACSRRWPPMPEKNSNILLEEVPDKPPARGREIVLDKELEAYRSVIEEPTEFKEGFTWIAVAGAFFCGLLMMPGAIYLSLITGGGIAAAWVTLIIFSEVSRRAMRTLSRQELVILLMVAGAM